MRVAIAFKCHSGWAAAMTVGARGSQYHLIDRRRVDLVDNAASWLSKQPYHAAEDLDADEAEQLVINAKRSTAEITTRVVADLIGHLFQFDHDIAACAVLMPSPMPAWTTAEILSVHFRMHKAEGVMYPEALVTAAQKCGLGVVTVPEKQLTERSQEAFGSKLPSITEKLAALGRSAGPPWSKDQKTAALAAVIALNL